jgi:hypothetical protein
MFEHHLNTDRVTQYQRQCQHEAAIERGLAAGRTAQPGIPRIAMARVARFFAAVRRQLHIPPLADLR